MPPDLPQRLAAILAADIAGYTRLMELDEAGTVAAWRLAREQVIDPTIARHGGRIVKLTGDGFLAEFSTVESAVRAALVMQDELTAAFAAQPADRRVGFRMGVDIGDIWVDDEDVYGTGVNIAARLEGLAAPGALCISDAVHAAVKHKIHAHYEDLGLQRVKNVAAPVHAWRASSVPQPRVRRRAADLARPAVAVAALAALAAGGVYSPAIGALTTRSATSGFHIVSRTFDKLVGEFLQIQDEVSNLVVANLRVALPSLAEEPVYVSGKVREPLLVQIRVAEPR